MTLQSGPLQRTRLRPKKNPAFSGQGFHDRSLAVTYSHMGKPHTTIGAERFHFRVRDGIGWFTLAIAARQTGWPRSQTRSLNRNVI